MNITPLNFTNMPSIAKIAFKSEAVRVSQPIETDTVNFSPEAKEKAEIKAKSEEILEKSKAVLEYAKKLHLQVEDLISQGEKNDFQDIETEDRIVKFNKSEETLTISEYDKSNPDKLLRKSNASLECIGYRLTKIAEKNGDKEDVYFFKMLHNIVYGYQQGYEELPDGTKRAEQEMFFDFDKLERIRNQYEELPDGTLKIGEIINFNGNDIVLYKKGIEYQPNNHIRTEKTIEFN